MVTALQNKQRIQSIDLLRGTVMIIMALDHVRDYFHKGAFMFDPLDLNKTSIVIFFTRWITHFCAPVFVFLAGTSAFLVGQRKTKKELSAFLFKRGLWLVFLELVVINFGWHFAIGFPWLLFIVIWALGVSMIALAALIHLPQKLILVTGILLVAGHNLLDGVMVQGNTAPAFGWALLHSPGIFSFGGENLFVAYPVIPWIGVMTLGYCFGTFYTPGYDAEKRKNNLLKIGGGAILLFIIIRCINLYGDPVAWRSYKNFLITILSYVKTTKYPPSLLYILMTLGPAIVFLALTENSRSRLTNIISIYGRVPMFYYLIHIYLIHLLAMLFTVMFTNFDWHIWILQQPLWINESFAGYGFSLRVVYLVWIIVVVGLYPLCKWYDRYKQTHKEKWWLSYL
ncbi:MAG: heparan-alpha-glucosaminide N-acetyltransferase domain-containing protein [Ferruginibacter sp.]